MRTTRFAATFGGVLLAVAALVMCLATPAGADVSPVGSAPFGSVLTTTCFQVNKKQIGVDYDVHTTRMCSGFDYNPATGHLRAYAGFSYQGCYNYTVCHFSAPGAEQPHLRATSLRLGVPGAILADSAGAGLNGFYELDTTGFTTCHANQVYRVHLRWAIRWVDHRVTSGDAGVYQVAGSKLCP